MVEFTQIEPTAENVVAAIEVSTPVPHSVESSTTQAAAEISSTNWSALAGLGFFLTICFLSSSVFWVLIGLAKASREAGRFTEGLMWCPAVAAFAAIRIGGWKNGDLGLRWARWRYICVGLSVPIAYSSFAYLLVSALGFASFPEHLKTIRLAANLGWHLSPGAFVFSYFAFTMLTGFVSSTARALGEEIGWRGYLTPLLTERLGFWGGTLVTSVIWTVWHLPLLLNGDYNNGASPLYSLVCFTVLVVGLSFLLSWLRLCSGSIWPCAFLHASHNLVIQGFFTPLTGTRGQLTSYAIDEFGFAVPLLVLVSAALILGWHFKRSALPTVLHPRRQATL